MVQPPVPLNTVRKLDAAPTKDVERAADGEIDLAPADAVHELEVGYVLAPAGVGDGDGAPLGQLGDEILVDPGLQALDVGGVDEELGTVVLEQLDVRYRS